MSENQTLHSAILSISHILPISLLNTWRLECLIVLPFYRVVKNAVPSWGLHVLQNNGGDSIRARDLQLQLWHVGNYMSSCFVFCNYSCSSVSFATLCVCCGPLGHIFPSSVIQRQLFPIISHSSASDDHRHYPAIVFFGLPFRRFPFWCPFWYSICHSSRVHIL